MGAVCVWGGGGDWVGGERGGGGGGGGPGVCYEKLKKILVL